MQPSPLSSDYVLRGRVVSPNDMTLHQLLELQQLVLSRGWYKNFSFVNLAASSAKRYHVSTSTASLHRSWLC
ncbi:hypothetical protein PILCRDRAFT_830543 [Piloderma croceum F 1598]|uniref:Uncharacterized protein n=1 Tax=Piloderma croceum (strain F 1598) TaxID=765440 RepID=A0A0C3EEP6_PILCF|nr:hypothetical protein PILCRDRAFT_830543 [Piloderma croceum F 1598]